MRFKKYLLKAQLTKYLESSPPHHRTFAEGKQAGLDGGEGGRSGGCVECIEVID
jgi:hypothetical protein